MSDVLFVANEDRYSRLRLIGWWNQERLRAAKILVVGAGALGNEVLKNLALVGVGRIWVVDFDCVEDSNLARSVLFREADRGRGKAIVAAEAVYALNSDVEVTAIHGNVTTDVGLGLFREADVIIGCLDNREARQWVNSCCWKANKPWIDGGIQEISGAVKVFVPPDGPCYECGLTENDYRLMNLRYSCPQLVREDLQAGKVPTTPTIASIIAGLQVQEALKLIHGVPTSAGEALLFHGVTNQFHKTVLQRREDCLSHETYPEPIELPLAAVTATADDLLTAAREHLNGNGTAAFSLDRDVVVSFTCGCGNSWRVMKPQPLVTESMAKCARCGETARPELVHTVVAGSSLAKETLASLGIPRFDIVRVVDDRGEHVFLLAGDRDK